MKHRGSWWTVGLRASLHRFNLKNSRAALITENILGDKN